MTNLLLYNISKEKEERLAQIFNALHLTYKIVLPCAFGESIGKLCGAPAHENDGAGPGIRFTDEMLVLCGLDGSALDLLLHALRSTGNAVRLKAVLTEHNASWSGSSLYAALAEEDAAFRNK